MGHPNEEHEKVQADAWRNGFCAGQAAGAAVAFGLIGMAAAIQDRELDKFRCGRCPRPEKK